MRRQASCDGPIAWSRLQNYRKNWRSWVHHRRKWVWSWWTHQDVFVCQSTWMYNFEMNRKLFCFFCTNSCCISTIQDGLHIHWRWDWLGAMPMWHGHNLRCGSNEWSCGGIAPESYRRILFHRKPNYIYIYIFFFYYILVLYTYIYIYLILYIYILSSARIRVYSHETLHFWRGTFWWWGH